MPLYLVRLIRDASEVTTVVASADNEDLALDRALVLNARPDSPLKLDDAGAEIQWHLDDDDGLDVDALDALPLDPRSLT
jgi:hypothetical protein